MNGKIADHASNGIYIQTLMHKITVSVCSPDLYSVYKYKQITIYVSLAVILIKKEFGNPWILTNRCSLLQHLSNWFFIEELIFLLYTLKLLSHSHKFHLWKYTSHVGLHNNEVTDKLAKQGWRNKSRSGISFTFFELFTNRNSFCNLSWHYQTIIGIMLLAPALFFLLIGNRHPQTILLMLVSRACLLLKTGRSVICTNCLSRPAGLARVHNCVWAFVGMILYVTLFLS